MDKEQFKKLDLHKDYKDEEIFIILEKPNFMLDGCGKLIYFQPSTRLKFAFK